jgi:hypothetical protein
VSFGKRITDGPWFSPLPGTLNRFRVVAVVAAPRFGPQQFVPTIEAPPVVLTTLRDDLPGTQQFAWWWKDPSATASPASGFNAAVGRMPLARQHDGPGSATAVSRAYGGGQMHRRLAMCACAYARWVGEGHSFDTAAGTLPQGSPGCAVLRHQQVDPDYQAGVNPAEDEAVLDSLLAYRRITPMASS